MRTRARTRAASPSLSSAVVVVVVEGLCDSVGEAGGTGALMTELVRPRGGSAVRSLPHSAETQRGPDEDSSPAFDWGEFTSPSATTGATMLAGPEAPSLALVPLALGWDTHIAALARVLPGRLPMDLMAGPTPSFISSGGLQLSRARRVPFFAVDTGWTDAGGYEWPELSTSPAPLRTSDTA